MESPKLCLCLPLKTGGIIIGIIDIVLGIINIVLSILALLVAISAPKVVDHVYTDHVKDGFSERNPHIESDFKAIGNVVSIFSYIFSGIYLFFGVVTIIVGAVLLYGIRKESPFPLKLWIIFRSIILLLSVPSVSLSAFSALTLRSFLDISVFLLAIWFIAVVHYLIKEFQAKKTSTTAPKDFMQEGYALV